LKPGFGHAFIQAVDGNKNPIKILLFSKKIIENNDELRRRAAWYYARLRIKRNAERCDIAYLKSLVF
jgi:hypothetical protein